MKCPGCHSVVSEKDKVCHACGYDLTGSISEIKDEKNLQNKNQKKIDKLRQNKQLRMILIIVGAVLVLLIILIIMLSLASSKGIRKSEKLAKKIGQPMTKAADYAGIEFSHESDFAGLSMITDSQYIFESDKKVKINGVNMPKWAVIAEEDIYGNLAEVKYYDFRVLEDNINGFKKKSRLDYTGIQPGTSEKAADKLMDMDPYVVSFTNENISKIYKYYCKDKQTENFEAYNVMMSFSSSGKKVNSQPYETENKLIKHILEISDQQEDVQK